MSSSERGEIIIPDWGQGVVEMPTVSLEPGAAPAMTLILRAVATQTSKVCQMRSDVEGFISAKPEKPAHLR